jgi:hypothetical protein
VQKGVDNTSNKRTQTQIVANRRSLFGVIRSYWLFARASFNKAEMKNPTRLAFLHYQIELLTNLDKVPESGAIVVVSFPKPKGGSGFPARVFAILP